MKVAFLIPQLGGGGAEKIAADLSRSIAKGYDPLFILFKEEVGYPFRGRIRSLNAPLKNSPIEPFAFILRMLKFNKIVTEEAPDVIMSFDDYASFLNAFSSSKRVFAIHKSLIVADIHKNILKRAIVRLFRKIIYSRADKIITVSEGIKDELIRYVGIEPNKIVVINNPFDLARIRSLGKQKPPIKLPSRYIISVGRCEVQKGQWHLIRAFSKVHSEIPDLKLVMIGRGSLSGYLNKLISDLGLSDSVILINSHFDNVHPLLKHSEFFVLPSLFEGFGNVLVESMALGVPVISTDCRAGPSEILGHYGKKTKGIVITKYGVLVPPPDGIMKGASERLSKEEELLADAIVELAEDPKLHLKLSKAGKIRSEAFASKFAIEKYEKVFRDVM
jgi:glycosyltransferase involved in cell wall biosynthesis